MPLQHSQAIHGRTASAHHAPQSPPSLPFAAPGDLIQRLANLLHTSREDLCAKLAEAVAPMVVEAIDEAIDEHAIDSHAHAQGARLGSVERHFQDFKRRYPKHWTKDVEPAVRAAFWRFPWENRKHLDEKGLTFAEGFWEGFERWLGSEEWTKDGGQYVPNAVNFLKGERFTQDGQLAADGRLSKGQSQLRRETEEKRNALITLRPVAAQVANALPKLEEPPPSPLQQSLIELIGVDTFNLWFKSHVTLSARDHCLEAACDNPMTHEWIRDHYTKTLAVLAVKIHGPNATLKITNVIAHPKQGSTAE